MRLTSLLAVALAALAAAGCANQPVGAPVVDRAPLAAPAPKAPVAQLAPIPGAGPGTYVVRPGDTLYSIALEQGVDYHDLARWNKLDDPTKISVGQTLFTAPPEERASAVVTVGAARGSGQVESHPLGASAVVQQGGGDGSTKTAPKALRLPYSKENLAMLTKGGQTAPEPAPQPAPQPAPAAPQPQATPPPASKPSASGGVAFIWPANGKVVAGFSEATNKGVDIGGKIGDPVFAAAPGRVMYTGTGIRGYGKLIVIKHDDGFNSVYAHNSQILVKEGQSVKRGERIAILGDTDSDKPKLHFEIRKSGKPVDPLKYLPGDRPAS
ncbi:MAG TPA: peptidoglycan DD-metalloendopeptidase family protein [Burkholderiales bacterium]|nr:peptidoglycan DD-metalloendopeptidase family protein [Burkholderiales bacterium]